MNLRSDIKLQKNLYHKKFALSIDRKQYETTLFLVEKLRNNAIYPHRIKIDKDEYVKDKKNSVSYIQISQNIRTRWQRIKLIEKLMSVDEYLIFLENEKNKKQGFIQKSISDFRFEDCMPLHQRCEVGDLILCRECRLSKCRKCDQEIKGLVNDLKDHFGLNIFDMNYLLRTFSATNYPGQNPICREDG